jgi:hypothetical protein
MYTCMKLLLPVEIISNILRYTSEPKLIKHFLDFLTKKDIRKIIQSKNLAYSIQFSCIDTIKGIFENTEEEILYTQILKLAVHNKNNVVFEYIFKKYIQQKNYYGHGYTLFPCIKSILNRDNLDLVVFLYHQDKHVFSSRYINCLVQELPENFCVKKFFRQINFLR